MRALWFLATLGLVAAEDGLSAWLRYAALPRDLAAQAHVPSRIVALNSTASSPVYTAGQELQRGIEGILGRRLRVGDQAAANGSSITVGTAAAFAKEGRAVKATGLGEDGFHLSITNQSVDIVGQNERGALYGAFEYLSMLSQGNLTKTSYTSNPSAPVRWINQWDNLDGSIERGYGGLSIFFADNTTLSNLTRVGDYARLMASIGLNGIVVNNVNADVNMLTDENIAGLARIADVMRPWGVRVGISLNFAAPQLLGGLSTYDPLDPSVIAWWDNITDTVYQSVPDMAGYLVKADSEGEPGPLTYNRTLAQGANLFARAAAPHGGIVMFRAFVYDTSILNESDWYADRANAAVNSFQGLDGAFADNVVVQIKYGPIDFQVREPTSPLFAHLRQTNTAIELEVAQEYLGEQCHLVYLPPLWKTVLDFDLRVDGEPSVVGSDILTGDRFGRNLTGYAAVVNVGQNATWLGSHLSMSNLYGYGRLAWDPTRDPEAVLRDWSRLTFGLDPQVVDTIAQMSMESWPAYENYSGNLGVQTLADITGTHFGPNPQSMDGNSWGQWTRADHDGIGMDRTVSNGTGNAGQYPPDVAAVYESLARTPDDLVLWFHHVPWTHRLRGGAGATVIQHFYDAHYNGAATAATFPARWQALEGLVDAQRFGEQMFRLVYQAGHAIVWRDGITQFYHNVSGIADEAGRVYRHPWRIEAEDMELTGYEITTVSPYEMASQLRVIQTNTSGSASATLPYPDGRYDLAVGYYDVAGGVAAWELSLNNRTLGAWRGDHEYRLGYMPTSGVDGNTATRVTFPNVDVRKGDVVQIRGTADGEETAAVDYLAVLPPGVVD
ncbi:glycoside hydrolase family 67 protein [Xylariaceae sp. FL0804]|nr:glycoside hydrolase family 67 protein [Xylariaceae sp. FL0804]